MKNKLSFIALFLVLVIGLASCASQKYGCPNNPQASYRFRG